MLTEREQQEHAKLLRLWALKKATRAQMLRCVELDRKSDDEGAGAYDYVRSCLAPGESA